MTENLVILDTTWLIFICLGIAFGIGLVLAFIDTQQNERIRKLYVELRHVRKELYQMRRLFMLRVKIEQEINGMLVKPSKMAVNDINKGEITYRNPT